jgi:ribosomal protein S10
MVHIELKKNTSPILAERSYKITTMICFASFKPITLKRQLAMNLARDLNLRAGSIADPKKKNKLLLSVISGPHVHKKSRDQYNMHVCRAYCAITIASRDEYKRFLAYKKQLYRLQVDEGTQLSFKHRESDAILIRKANFS